jgi:hypothetical protein
VGRALDHELTAVLLRRALALGALAVGLLPFSAGAAPDPSRLPTVPACADTTAVTRVGSWAAVRAPAFSAQPLGQGQDVSAYVVSPHDQRRVFATNGTSIEASNDAGCTWHEVYVLPLAPTDEDPLSIAGSRITKLVVPDDERVSQRVLAIAQEITGAGRPHVLVSQDGTADSFVRRDNGLPPVGTATDLAVAPTNADFVWLSVRTGSAVPALPVAVPGLPATQGRGVLCASVNGGRDYEVRVDTGDALTATTGIDRLVTDPLAANQLWAIGDGLLRHSNDAGRTWTAAAPSTTEQRDRGWDVTAAVVDASGSRARTVYAFSATSAQGGGPVLLTSTDSGETFDDTAAPGPVESAALVGKEAPLLAASTSGTRPRVLVRTGSRFEDLTPRLASPGYAVSTDGTPRATLHARAPRALLRYVGPLLTPPPPVAPPIGAVVHDGGLPPLGVGRFTPAADHVDLAVGDTTLVPHRLELPRRATPLDLYVLLDTTLSMKDDLRRVSADVSALTQQLLAQGVDLRVGLGEFKGHQSGVGYRRVLGIGPHAQELEAAMASLVADGSGLEMQLIALDQALDGLGEGPDALLPDPCKASEKSPDRYLIDERRTTPLVPAGQQADFEPTHAKAVLVVTDTTFLRPAGTRLTSACEVDVATTAGNYAARGVAVLGLGVDDIDNPITAGDLTELARTTKAWQPDGRRACSPELLTGPPPYPAVCRSATALVPSLLDLVARQTEPRPVRFQVTAGAGDVTFPAELRADLRHPTTLEVPVWFGCDEVGTRSGVVSATTAGKVIARLPFTVVCSALPGPPAVPRGPEVLPPALGLPLVPAAAPPAAPPAQVVQPQVQVQPNLQAAHSDQEQDQAELAHVGVRPEPEQERGVTQLAMVRRRQETDAAISMGLLLAVSSAAAVGWARTRTAHLPEVSHVRR